MERFLLVAPEFWNTPEGSNSPASPEKGSHKKDFARLHRGTRKGGPVKLEPIKIMSNSPGSTIHTIREGKSASPPTKGKRKKLGHKKRGRRLKTRSKSRSFIVVTCPVFQDGA